MEETIRCPYCDCKVRVSAVETDDGSCPECGAPLTGSLAFAADEASGDPYDEDDDSTSFDAENERRPRKSPRASDE